MVKLMSVAGDRYGDQDRGSRFASRDIRYENRDGSFGGNRDTEKSWVNRDGDSRDSDRSWGNRDGGSRYGDRDSDRSWGNKDRGSFGGDRDRGYGGDRDRGYGGDRDRGYGGDRDRGYGGDRSFGGDRDRGYGGDRYGDRDRGRNDDRDGKGHKAIILTYCSIETICSKMFAIFNIWTYLCWVITLSGIFSDRLLCQINICWRKCYNSNYFIFYSIMMGTTANIEKISMIFKIIMIKSLTVVQLNSLL